jgi:hypothetical protein
MIEVIDTAVLPEESTVVGERIECAGICHNGPIDDSPKALRYAAVHDPEAPAAYLFVFPCCNHQLPLCENKVDSLLEWGMLGNGDMKCNTCRKSVPISEALFLPLNQ